jgi:hypothetical protein
VVATYLGEKTSMPVLGLVRSTDNKLNAHTEIDSTCQSFMQLGSLLRTIGGDSLFTVLWVIFKLMTEKSGEDVNPLSARKSAEIQAHRN